MPGFAGFIGEKDNIVKNIQQGLRKSLDGKLFQRNFANSGFQAIADFASHVYYPATKHKDINLAFVGKLSDSCLNETNDTNSKKNQLAHIAKLYKSEGVKGLKKLSGSFCYVISDSAKNCTIIARGDALSPDIWTSIVKDNLIYFTEFEVIQSVREFEIQLNSAALVEYLIMDSADIGRNFYENVVLLKPESINVYKSTKNYTLKANNDVSTEISLETSAISNIEDFVFSQVSRYEEYTEDSAIVLSEGSADVFLSIFLPIEVKRIIPYFDSFFLFPGCKAEEIKHKSQKLNLLFENILPDVVFEEVNINLQDDNSKNTQEYISELFINYVKSLPFPDARLFSFKQYVLLDKLKDTGIENFIIADPLDDLLVNKTKMRKKNNFLDTICKVFNFLGTEEREIATDVTSFYCEIFEWLSTSNNFADKEVQFQKIQQMGEMLKQYKPYNKIFADVFLDKKSQFMLFEKSINNFDNSKFANTHKHFSQFLKMLKFNQKFSAINTLARAYNIEFSTPLHQNLNALKEIFMLDELIQYRNIWVEIIEILDVKTIFSKNSWSDYLGKVWLLKKTEQSWHPLLKNPLVLDLNLITHNLLAKILTEYKNRTFDGVLALFNIVVLELWLNQNY